MASTNLSYNGSTGVLEASASVYEITTTGTSRKIHLSLFIKPIDYGGARTFGWEASGGGEYSSGNNSVLDGSGRTIFDEDITVSVPYGSTTASISFNFSCTVVSPSAGNKSISGTITKINGLTLAQGSSNISSAASTYFGSACSISWTPPSTSVYNKLRFTLGSWSGETGIFRPGTTSVYTYTGYTIPMAAANQIPNADSATMSVTLYTYSNSSGTSQTGTSSTSFTVRLPASAKPSITAKSISVDNSSNSTINSWGIAVTGFSKLHITATASGSYGSTISRFIIEGVYEDAVVAPSLDYVGKIIQTSGNKSASIYCVDSRGRISDSVTTSSVTFYPYTAPSISHFTALRDENGYANLNVSFIYDSIGNHNTATAILWYKQSGSNSVWVKYPTAMTNNSTLTTNIVMKDEISYNFRVVLTDSVGSSIEKTAFLSTAKVLLDFKAGGDGLGIGKVCENPGLEVSMDATFFSEVNIGEITLEQYIKNAMKILPPDMYGSKDPPANAVIGQIYFRKL